ncbi:hypothetical protein GCM10023194_30200 [Planotetraspora phitsanulokensis]|uniref:Uncharacterized protein n=1 Tax=Planotetraspora phitsanulokensis TaxID=575192 RepID=A0A8J3XC80_9ACTN|nr:hypothetical protein [Planotetraspora phitsanulokensis]GII35842.1 hypothetical protein Pph01_08450 [Planotetraspora phitsanulokensis]
MTVFVCANCGAVLTAPVSQVALPAHAHQTYGHELLPVLLESGTYAVDPEPSGPPRRRWEEVGAEEAEARGVYAPVYSLSYGPPGAIAVAPGDVRGTVLIPERCDGYCLGLDGRDGPNLACAQCGDAVGTRIDDCSFWQVVWLDPCAVRRVVKASTRRVLSWEALREECPETPPVEPIGAWSPVWEAVIAVALAHLVAVSGGVRVVVPDGPIADMFRPAIDSLLPPGPPAKTLAPVGPGLSAASTDIALVPLHPQTGEAWPSEAQAAVPLAADVWMHLAFNRDRRLIPATGGLPDGVHRDDPPPLLPFYPFRTDRDVFLHTLARMPEVRQPWLRAIYDRVKAGRFGHRPW